MSSFSEFSTLFCYASESFTDSDDESSIPIPKQAVSLALPPSKRRGKFVSIKGGLLFVQHYDVDVDSKEFQGILRYDVGANKWTEWIPYPKGTRIFAQCVVVDEKRKMLYIFQDDDLDDDNAKWLTIVNITKKIFRTESTEIWNTYGSIVYPTLVMAGEVIYIYHSDKCLKWNVDTNQSEEELQADFSAWLGAYDFDLLYMEPQNRILMMDVRTLELVCHSIEDNSITKYKVCGLESPLGNAENDGFLIRFITLTADYRYLIVIGVFYSDDDEFEDKERIYVMDLKSASQRNNALSCQWNEAEIATMVGGYIREMYESNNENGRIIPTEIHNIIANYLSVQELLHVINFDKVHFAISIDDILLARLN